MARLHLDSHLSGKEQSLGEVWKWYSFQAALIGEEAVRTLNALLAGGLDSPPRYFSMARDELDRLFEKQREELCSVTMLSLLTTTEAGLRVKYITSVRENKKDNVSKALAALYKEQKLKVGLKEDLLEIWKQHAGQPLKDAIGEFKGALGLRHWLAHGRYWKLRLAREYDPQTVFDICNSLVVVLAI